MLIDNEFEIGDYVYLSTDVEQQIRIVTSIAIRNKGIIYYLSCGANESSHYDFEITRDVNVLITSNN